MSSGEHFSVSNIFQQLALSFRFHKNIKYGHVGQGLITTGINGSIYNDAVYVT